MAPAECAEDPSVGAYLARLVAAGGPIREILTFDLRQSMRNGGGPACLRLRQTTLSHPPPKRRRHLREGEVRDNHVFCADESLVQGIAFRFGHEEFHERAGIEVDGLRPS